MLTAGSFRVNGPRSNTIRNTLATREPGFSSLHQIHRGTLPPPRALWANRFGFRGKVCLGLPATKVGEARLPNEMLQQGSLRGLRKTRHSWIDLLPRAQQITIGFAL